ncbi:ser-thr gpi-anchored family protein [Phialemonium atrogriseum]|uniref:Ser-thr gpi-anchored family protein n=1 Tax=Phialemonium atrogriseum TaxID=1093897 RepID=A0AAJ0FTT5_9PEZI|nr:ser-thr gpi-anchored family protein [Phialemonium atrogriseum]KAK1772470.1 ser-thr gpi-anchored family protein [Phialemonium atrogriseum]
MLLLVFVFLTTIPLASSQFSNPPPKRTVWSLGEVQTIRYRTTFSNYTIALWQQSLQKGAASLGPIIFQTTTGGISQFDWPVQTYDLDLNASNVFFLWLFQGAASNQGNQSSPGMSSAFFNLTADSTTGSTTSSTTSPTTSSTTSPTAASPFTSAVTSRNSTANATAAGGDTSATGIRTSEDSSGLSTGARAGIGVGVTIGGLAAIACVVIWFRYLNKKQRALTELTERVSQLPQGMKEQPPPPIPYYAQEIGPGHRHLGPAELG